MAKILARRVVHDKDNQCWVQCVRFDGPPTTEDLKKAHKIAAYPWGTQDNPQAFPSSYLPKQDGWWDVGHSGR
jgi:hypothetical protein